MELYNIHFFFVAGLFCLACLQGLPMLYNVSEFPSFLRLDNIPLSTVSLFTCQWIHGLPPHFSFCE